MRYNNLHESDDGDIIPLLISDASSVETEAGIVQTECDMNNLALDLNQIFSITLDAAPTARYGGKVVTVDDQIIYTTPAEAEAVLSELQAAFETVCNRVSWNRGHRHDRYVVTDRYDERQREADTQREAARAKDRAISQMFTERLQRQRMMEPRRSPVTGRYVGGARGER